MAVKTTALEVENLSIIPKTSFGKVAVPAAPKNMATKAMTASILRLLRPLLKLPIAINISDTIDNRTTRIVTTYTCMKDWKLPS